eukprot:TRINITY_DN795_c0_g1_i1.p1 TRINITY_DN795_c0_g1~~TRINITY_DN795_c0_g1_i1.p1  ORF type:complete len:525 (-),score=182.12 TRINITY_DN795_c0_g1_i1:323-1807(-)
MCVDSAPALLANNISFMPVVHAVLRQHYYEPHFGLLAEGVANLYHQHNALADFRRYLIEQMVRNTATTIGLLRESSVEWALLCTTLRVEGVTGCLARSMKKMIKRINKGEGHANFLRKVDGREEVRKDKLERLAFDIIELVFVSMCKDSYNGWVNCVYECLAHVSETLERTGHETFCEMTVMASIFFLPIFCPFLLHPEDHGSVPLTEAGSRRMVWVCKAIMSAVAGLIEVNEHAHADAPELSLVAKDSQQILQRIATKMLEPIHNGAKVPPRLAPESVEVFVHAMVRNNPMVTKCLQDMPELLATWREIVALLQRTGRYDVNIPYGELYERVKEHGVITSDIQSATSRSISCKAEVQRVIVERVNEFAQVRPLRPRATGDAAEAEVKIDDPFLISSGFIDEAAAAPGVEASRGGASAGQSSTSAAARDIVLKVRLEDRARLVNMRIGLNTPKREVVHRIADALGIDPAKISVPSSVEEILLSPEPLVNIPLLR